MPDLPIPIPAAGSTVSELLQFGVEILQLVARLRADVDKLTLQVQQHEDLLKEPPDPAA